MICPYCDKEMKKGYLQGNGSRIIWDTKKHRISVNASEEGIPLAFNFNVATVDNVYCCWECKKIIFQYEET